MSDFRVSYGGEPNEIPAVVTAAFTVIQLKDMMEKDTVKKAEKLINEYLDQEGEE